MPDTIQGPKGCLTMSTDTHSKLFDLMTEMGHEQVLFSNDPAAGYRGIIAIHSTVLGPAVGGTRVWNYASADRRASAFTRDDLQVRGRGATVGRRQIDYHRRQQDDRSREGLSRARPLRRSVGRTICYRRRCGHEPG